MVVYLAIWCVISVLFNLDEPERAALMMVAWLTGSVQTFWAMKVR